MSNTFECPQCGADVPLRARACPACGSDEQTGWSEAADYAHLLPDDAEDDVSRTPASAIPWLPVIVGGVSLLVVVLIAGWEQLIIPSLLLIALAAAMLAIRSRTVGPAEKEVALYDRLLMRARGDKALVDRLVAYEEQRNPTGDRTQHLADALERWERDAR